MSDQLIPTLAMANDPRLRRLFALVGRILDGAGMTTALSPRLEDELQDVMLALAPEYLPPDDTDDEHLREQWDDLVHEAIRGGGGR